MASGFYQQLNDSTGTKNSSGTDFSNEVGLNAEPVTVAKAINVNSKDFNNSGSDIILKDTLFYTPDTLWNTSSEFLSENPLSQISHPVAHDALYGITVRQSQKSIENAAIPRTQNKGEDLLTGIMLIVTALSAVVSVLYSKYYAQLKDSILNFQISLKLYNEKNTMYKRVSVVFDFIYLIVTAIFIHRINSFYEIFSPGKSSLYYLFIVFAAIVCYSLLRIALLRFTGFLFDNKAMLYSYIHQMSIFNRGAAIVLLPLSIALLSSPHLYQKLCFLPE
jgi:hypothetical protein